ncbi:peptidylprolyl isomerase [Vibrio sp. JC009]|uniref:peptidylprolyl isomerase n=1 Tax=Vibrio sp. JC009 TaxID=2912314 RepID=UPI0023B1D06B|nr:peptidylprolyl isomerase [Vibrio sp. JC009]WED22447.1 peptidylprolyl isomerase [Vibrio sp. JC009]
MRRFFISLLCLFSATAFSAPTVVVDTTMGTFEVELYSEKAPITVENFLTYVKDGSYEGSIFHRVIPGFMAQGGGFDTDMKRLKSNAPIKNEASNRVLNETATIAMARTKAADSATRQFFINYADNDFLDFTHTNPGYAVFGKVTKGFEVVQEMAKQPTASLERYHDVPVTAIVINKITIK